MGADTLAAGLARQMVQTELTKHKTWRLPHREITVASGGAIASIRRSEGENISLKMTNYLLKRGRGSPAVTGVARGPQVMK